MREVRSRRRTGSIWAASGGSPWATVDTAEAAQHRSPVTSTSGPASRSQKTQVTCHASPRRDAGTRESRRNEVSHQIV